MCFGYKPSKPEINKQAVLVLQMACKSGITALIEYNTMLMIRDDQLISSLLIVACAGLVIESGAAVDGRIAVLRRATATFVALTGATLTN